MIVALMLLAAEPTNGWQYTQWGMTEAEVKAAAPNRIIPFVEKSADRPGSFSRLLTTHKSGDLSFNVSFRFSSAGKLNGILVIPTEYKNCSRILDELRSAYGAPEEFTPSRYQMRARWRAPETNLIVKFLSSETMDSVSGKAPPYCEIDYTPATSPGRIGF